MARLEVPESRSRRPLLRAAVARWEAEPSDQARRNRSKRHVILQKILKAGVACPRSLLRPSLRLIALPDPHAPGPGLPLGYFAVPCAPCVKCTSAVTGAAPPLSTSVTHTNTPARSPACY